MCIASISNCGYPRIRNQFARVVAYDEQVKFDVLGVEPGPLVSTRCAEQMAAGAARLLQADAVIALTGVGGPEPDEGKPPGTAVMAARGCWQGSIHPAT